jgi:hypothetical protein
MIYCVALAVSFVNLLNHFGKIGCKGDGVSVTVLRGHKNQGQLVTLRANKKANVVNTVFMSETKILYRRGSGVVDVSGKKAESSSETRCIYKPFTLKLRSSCGLTRGYGALHISSVSSQWQDRSMRLTTR